MRACDLMDMETKELEDLKKMIDKELKFRKEYEIKNNKKGRK